MYLKKKRHSSGTFLSKFSPRGSLFFNQTTHASWVPRRINTEKNRHFPKSDQSGSHTSRRSCCSREPREFVTITALHGPYPMSRRGICGHNCRRESHILAQARGCGFHDSDLHTTTRRQNWDLMTNNSTSCSIMVLLPAAPSRSQGPLSPSPHSRLSSLRPSKELVSD